MYDNYTDIRCALANRRSFTGNSAECDSFTDVPITNQLTLEV